MKPSAELQNLLATGIEKGWSYGHREIASRLIREEGSAALSWLFRQMTSFVKAEDVLAGIQVEGFALLVEKDPGADASIEVTQSHGGQILRAKSAPSTKTPKTIFRAGEATKPNSPSVSSNASPEATFDDAVANIQRLLDSGRLTLADVAEMRAACAPPKPATQSGNELEAIADKYISRGRAILFEKRK